MYPREAALDVLMEAEKSGAFASVLIRGVLDKYNYEDPKEKAFFKRLSEGVLERRITLDYCLDRFSKTPVRKMKPLIRNLMRLAAYQILYMDGVPDAAACNEAVKLAKKRGFSSLSGFVNGVLRSLSRGRHEIAWPDETKEPAYAMSVRYSIPQWLVEKWMDDYGAEETGRILDGLMKERPVTIRFCAALGEEGVREAAARIAASGAAVTPHCLYPHAYELSGCDGVTSISGFEKGDFYVQDVSSMLAVEAAGIKPGMNVLDICAAPGGKTLLAAEKLKGTGKIRAFDISEAKILKIRQNARRMGFPEIETDIRDARTPEESLYGWADVVLADVPCSGFGVMGRKKDIRYRVHKEDLESLARLQREILTTAQGYVKPGGVLLYSTCTVNRAENEEMVRFVTEHFPFEAESLNPYLPPALRNQRTERGYLQLLPGIEDTDGFFFARLVRKG